MPREAAGRSNVLITSYLYGRSRRKNDSRPIGYFLQKKEIIKYRAEYSKSKTRVHFEGKSLREQEYA